MQSPDPGRGFRPPASAPEFHGLRYTLAHVRKPRFFRYELRTTDLDAARAFYADIFGSHFWDSEVALTRLPERAAALGAPAHWLGHLGPCEVEAATRYIVESGGQQLGAVQRGPDGASSAVLRDPFGSIVAVSTASSPSRSTRVAWHLLNTRDHPRAFTFYASLCGWTA